MEFALTTAVKFIKKQVNRALQSAEPALRQYKLSSTSRETPEEFVIEGDDTKPPVWARSYIITSWPRGLSDLWAELLASKTVFRVRFTTAPSTFRWSPKMEQKLSRLMNDVENQAKSKKTAAPRADEVTAMRAIMTIRDALLYHGMNAVDVWAIVTVLSDSKEHLDIDCSKVMNSLRQRGVAGEVLRFEQELGFMATLPVGPTQFSDFIHRPFRTGIVPAVAKVVPTDTGKTGSMGGIYIGHEVINHVPVYLDFRQEDTELNASTVVFGATGEGKSTWLKSVPVAGGLFNGWYVIVLDIDREYEKLCQQFGGVFIDLSGATGRYPDPCRFAERSGNPDEDMGLYDRMFGGISRTFTIILGESASEMEKAVIEQEIKKALEDFGVIRQNPITWDNAKIEGKLTLKLIYDRIYARAQANINDQWAGMAAQKLWRFFEGSLSNIFENPIPMQTMPNRLVVFHLGNPKASTVDDQTITIKYTLAMQTIWEWLRQNKESGRWTNVIVDEGQRAFKNAILADNLAELATTIRKWRGNVFMGTNAPLSLWESASGDMIWGNSLYKVVFALEENQLNALKTKAQIPDGVFMAIRDQMTTRVASVRIGTRDWTQVKLALPPEELELYRTRKK